MKKLLLIICITIFYGCDSVKDLPAPQIYVANIPPKTVLTLSAYFPEATNFISKEISPTKLWEITMETNGKNIRVMADQDGDIFNYEELYGSNTQFPIAIVNYLKETQARSSIKSIAKLFQADIPVGFEVSIFDKNEIKKLEFDLNGTPTKEVINFNQLQIDKIIYTNNSLYLTDNEIDNGTKTIINAYNQTKFDLKIIVFTSGEKLIEYLEKNDPNKLNDKIEFLIGKDNKLLRKYEYLSAKQLNYNLINNLNNFDIKPEEKAILNDYKFNIGVQFEKFELENSTELSFTNKLGNKYLVKFLSKNSFPKITAIKPLNISDLPVAINSYVNNNFSNAIINNCRTVSKEADNIDDKNSKIDKYLVEITIGGYANQAKKILLFDENLNLTK
jgi:hypothetical protein